MWHGITKIKEWIIGWIHEQTDAWVNQQMPEYRFEQFTQEYRTVAMVASMRQTLSKHDTLKQCCFNVGPAFRTLGQRKNNIVPVYDGQKISDGNFFLKSINEYFFVSGMIWKSKCHQNNSPVVCDGHVKYEEAYKHRLVAILKTSNGGPCGIQ